MEYVKLGNSDLNASRICLGCMGFGDSKNGQHSWTVGENETRAIVKRALESGINFFDTAIAYQNGTNEQYLGRAVKDFSRREDVIIATKFLPRTPDEIKNDISAKEHIDNMVNKSLENLGTDYIDLYIYHMWDWNTPIYDIVAALDGIVQSGKVRYIGISNCFAWQIAKANYLAEREGFAKFISVQSHYNLIFREEEREMMQYCSEENIAMAAYSPLASGRLSRMEDNKTKRAVEDSYAKFKYDSTKKQDGLIINRVFELAQKYNVTMSEVAISWLLEKVACPIVGATKLEHMDAPCKALDLKLTKEDIDYLEEQYIPHSLSGVMAQNRPQNATKTHIWHSANTNIGVKI